MHEVVEHHPGLHVLGDVAVRHPQPGVGGVEEDVDRLPRRDQDGVLPHQVRFGRTVAGQRVKIRLVNEMDSDHPMHHPFHIHGAGRFLVLSRDGVPAPNLVWKDTVLIPTGQTVDILLDVTNPGLWMAHCHIAEHMHSGMMFSFDVEE